MAAIYLFAQYEGKTMSLITADRRGIVTAMPHFAAAFCAVSQRGVFPCILGADVPAGCDILLYVFTSWWRWQLRCDLYTLGVEHQIKIYSEKYAGSCELDIAAGKTFT